MRVNAFIRELDNSWAMAEVISKIVRHNPMRDGVTDYIWVEINSVNCDRTGANERSRVLEG